MYRYRSDVDGLRALAILPVLLFHAELDQFSGGYIGVDIFFVISGYLITSIIAAELEKDQFTIVGFYERRVRRIFPALLTVLIVCIVISHVLMLPNEYRDFGQSVFATMFFSSNLLFWMEAGYFDAESLMKPLLHTWSLAVEEQYYIFYPPLLILIYRFLNKRGRPLILGLWLASFVWSVWSTYHSPTAAFYLTLSRVWELLTGAIIALGYIKEVNNKAVNEVMGVSGLLLVLYAVFEFDHTTPFPGYTALVPCVGTAMIIYSGSTHNTLVSRLLSNKLMVFTGLISYSLYLWHWPILVFTHLYLDEPFEPWLVFCLLALSYFLAWFSWRFIEKPFRGKHSKYTPKQMFSGAVLVMACMSAFGLVLHLNRGFPERMPESVNKIVDMIELNHSYLPENCLLKGGEDLSEGVTPCKIDKTGDPSHGVVLWGDSHAASLVPGLLKLSDADDSISIQFIGMQGCPPLKGILHAANEETPYENCADFNEKVLDQLSLDNNVKVVILSGYWSLYANGIRTPTDPNPGAVYLCETESCDNLSTEDNRALLKKGLKNILDVLSANGKRVILIGPIPDLEINGATTIARMRLLDRVFEVRSSWDYMRSHLDPAVTLLVELQDGAEITSVFPHIALCGIDYCNIEIDGMPLYVDRHHLSSIGAEFVVEKLGLDRMLPVNYRR
jgi:peptidoglycan/LPS O-acetylase OafA/YrhL